MKALIQRVSSASVTVDQQVVGAIHTGLLVLLGVEKDDTEQHLKKLAEKVLKYRVFSDENGKMNLNVQQAGGALLVVSQFTLLTAEILVLRSLQVSLVLICRWRWSIMALLLFCLRANFINQIQMVINVVALITAFCQ